MKQIIIVPIDDKIYRETFEDNIGHQEKYKQFIQDNNLPIMCSIDLGYVWGKALCLNNYLNVMIENNLAVCLVPKNISDNQYEWLIKHYKTFSKLDSKFLILDVNYEEYYEEQKTFFKQLKKNYKEVKNENRKSI